MMTQIQEILKDGIYSCELNINKQQWLEILQDNVLTGNAKEVLLKFFYSSQYKNTCFGISPDSPQSVNGIITAFGKRVSKKFDLSVIGTDGKQTYWIVPMGNGRKLPDGYFEWTLRKELVEAIKDFLILDLIKRYKDKFLNYPLDKNHADELYKWQLITDCRNKTEIDIIKRIKSRNIVDAPRINLILTDLLNKEENNLVSNFQILEDENVILIKRLEDFKHKMSVLCGNNYQMKANDERTASAFLACVNPAKYTFYKDELYQNYCKYIGENPKNPGEKYPHYLQLLEPLSNAVKQDIALQNKFKTETNGLIQSDLLVAQNILWQMRNDMFSTVETKDNNQMQEIQQLTTLLSHKKNIILQGAPGVGKTYTTAALALSICGENVPDDHDSVMKRYEELQKDGRIGFVTFHQSMDYEDFVEGIKPQLVADDKMIYQVENGIFKIMCNNAQQKKEGNIIKCIDKYIESINGYKNRKLIPTLTGKSSLYVWWNTGNATLSTRSSYSTSSKDPEYTPSPINIEKLKMQAVGEGIENNWPSYAQAIINAVQNEYKNELKNDNSNTPYVLIIDEINRGNVSKIFGELITLLEADKRIGGKHPLKVTLPYSKDEFGVPSNLYIIGTMNTTDRSVGNIDYAVRRRFAFVTLESKREIVERYSTAENAVNLFDAVKTFIENNKIEMDFDDLMVGHSYFLAADDDELQMKWQYEIMPLLREYHKDGLLNQEVTAKTFEEFINETNNN